MSIGIIDYGLGNLKAFESIFSSLGIDSHFCTSAYDLNASTKLILPGVGSFDWAVTRLREQAYLDRLSSLVLESGIPILGVCVGMQIMTSSSEEGSLTGLSWIPGTFSEFKFPPSSNSPLPHLGWNSVVSHNTPFLSISNDYFYFLHSFHFVPDDPMIYDNLCISNYQYDFISAYQYNNIYGVQFHPEKSHHAGLRLLQSFSSL